MEKNYDFSYPDMLGREYRIPTNIRWIQVDNQKICKDPIMLCMKRSVKRSS